MIGPPPLLAGGSHVTTISRGPGVSVTACGWPGGSTDGIVVGIVVGVAVEVIDGGSAVLSPKTNLVDSR